MPDIGFKYYDGNTGKVFHVKEFIPDGKHVFVEDIQEKLDVEALMRWSDDGGIHPEKYIRGYLNNS